MIADPAFAERAQRASCWLALLLPAALFAGLSRASLSPLAIVGPAALGLLLLQLRAFGDPRSRLPNLITAGRVALTAGLCLWRLSPSGNAAVICLVFVLDGLDGLVARRLGAGSLQGAHFDLEADAYLVLTVCGLLGLAGLGPWVLLGGLLRYLYVLASWLPGARGQAPRSRFGRYAFATALTALTLALLLRGVPAVLLAALGNGVLLWSFGRSFWWSFAVRSEAAR